MDCPEGCERRTLTRSCWNWRRSSILTNTFAVREGSRLRPAWTSQRDKWRSGSRTDEWSTRGKLCPRRTTRTRTRTVSRTRIVSRVVSLSIFCNQPELPPNLSTSFQLQTRRSPAKGATCLLTIFQTPLRIRAVRTIARRIYCWTTAAAIIPVPIAVSLLDWPCHMMDNLCHPQFQPHHCRVTTWSWQITVQMA